MVDPPMIMSGNSGVGHLISKVWMDLDRAVDANVS